MGDPHGAHRAVAQVTDRAGFDPDHDRLVVLGDVCDGWPEADLICDTLLRLRNLVLIRGNHDLWALRWMREGLVDSVWIASGGLATLDAYARRAGRPPPRDVAECAELSRLVPAEHRALLEDARPFLTERRPGGRKVLYAHAGWDPSRPECEQDESTLFWDRSFFEQARQEGPPITDFDEVYIGHTPTATPVPVRYREVWALDQGAGWEGRLTLFNVDDQSFVQSDPVPELYPETSGRGG